MRIAYFTECYDPFVNGVVVLIKHFRQRLEAQGHEVVIFAPEHPTHRDDDEAVVRLPSVNWSRRAYPFLRPPTGIDHQFRRWQFDVLHSHHPFTCGLLSERLAREYELPLVYTFHTLLTDYTHYVPLPSAWSGQGLLQIVLRHCARADRLTVTTRIMRNWLLEHNVTTPISVVAPGVELPDPPPDARAAMRRRWGLGDDETVLLFAGRMANEKNAHWLLRVLAPLSRRHAFRLLMVGDGPERESLQAEARQLGLGNHVLFTGQMPHDAMPGVYAAADMFVFPSASETFGLVILEAMAAGLPCVAINQNGPAEVVLDGHTGFLCPLEPGAFSSAVERLLVDRDLRERMGVAARRHAQVDWSADAGAVLASVYAAAREDRARRDALGTLPH